MSANDTLRFVAAFPPLWPDPTNLGITAEELICFHDPKPSVRIPILQECKGTWIIPHPNPKPNPKPSPAPPCWNPMRLEGGRGLSHAQGTNSVACARQPHPHTQNQLTRALKTSSNATNATDTCTQIWITYDMHTVSNHTCTYVSVNYAHTSSNSRNMERSSYETFRVACFTKSLHKYDTFRVHSIYQANVHVRKFELDSMFYQITTPVDTFRINVFHKKMHRHNSSKVSLLYQVNAQVRSL